MFNNISIISLQNVIHVFNVHIIYMIVLKIILNLVIVLIKFITAWKWCS